MFEIDFTILGRVVTHSLDLATARYSGDKSVICAEPHSRI